MYERIKSENIGNVRDIGVWVVVNYPCLQAGVVHEMLIAGGHEFVNADINAARLWT